MTDHSVYLVSYSASNFAGSAYSAVGNAIHQVRDRRTVAQAKSLRELVANLRINRRDPVSPFRIATAIASKKL